MFLHNLQCKANCLIHLNSKAKEADGLSYILKTVQVNSAGIFKNIYLDPPSELKIRTAAWGIPSDMFLGSDQQLVHLFIVHSLQLFTLSYLCVIYMRPRPSVLFNEK
jgi:hypothetical protein